MYLDRYLTDNISLFKEELENGDTNCSLYAGFAGDAITCFILGKYTKDLFFLEKGHELLNRISDQITSVSVLDFANGLAGIGWTVEWLKQSNFIKVNTDEILEDIDDTLYKAVVYSPSVDISLEKGTLSKATYFLKRYKSVNPNTHRFKTICHQECLVILSDELKEKVCKSRLAFPKVSGSSYLSDEIVKIGQALFFIGEIWQLKINLATVEDILYYLAENINIFLKEVCSSFNRICNLSRHYTAALQYLAYTWYIAGEQLNCNYWRKQASKYSYIILKHSTPINYSVANDLFVSALLIRILDKGNIRELKSKFSNPEGVIIHDQLKGVRNRLLVYLANLSPELTRWDELLQPYKFISPRYESIGIDDEQTLL